MQKINLHTIENQDSKFFDLCYNSINLYYYEKIEDILFCDKYNYPLIDNNMILNYSHQIKNYLDFSTANKIVFMNLREGTTIPYLTEHLGFLKFIESLQIIIISSGDSGNYTQAANLDCFINLTCDLYNQTVSLNNFSNLYNTVHKPYKFLFLNKTYNSHREKLINKLKDCCLLDESLWSCHFTNNLIPIEYKDYFNDNHIDTMINNTVHDFSWPDGRIVPELFIDTYFSVITETNFYYPANFRTEKIYKALLIGHPFIVVSNCGFYRGLHDLGFKTFDNLINETFDKIENNEDRMNSIVQEIKRLCNSNLEEFLKSAKPICEYNRDRLFELIGTHTATQYKLLNNLFNNLGH